jgi:hypothetical protein
MIVDLFWIDQRCLGFGIVELSPRTLGRVHHVSHLFVEWVSHLNHL